MILTRGEKVMERVQAKMIRPTTTPIGVVKVVVMVTSIACPPLLIKRP